MIYHSNLVLGWPSLYESGRNLREIDFRDSVQVGQFQGYDFFADGSFYIIDSPGHAIGHIGALARTTTNPDTFIFMGGDLCHHSGEIRPSKHMHIPQDIQLRSTIPTSLPCPGALVYQELLIQRTGSIEKPFFRPNMGLDIKQAMDTIEKAQEADAESNVWFIYAHDPSLLGNVDLFPLSANEWKKRNWREKTLWNFLQDLVPAAHWFRQLYLTVTWQFRNSSRIKSFQIWCIFILNLL